jgi:transposase InsO family protein
MAHKRKRKPYGLKKDNARQIIELDMNHIQLLGVKLYAFCGIDQFTREAVVHIATSPSSKNAKTAIKKIIARFGTGIKITNDNGSENMKDAETFLAQMNITQYWTRPYTPKDKAFNERFHRALYRDASKGVFGLSLRAFERGGAFRDYRRLAG